ncbi:hypothetical protein Atai01_74310 [Amycolatopsis taiwanensis]|uniref:Uncharacterized protein n=1 Tax=Amycolatopsis taiwanensis TaxID=342230 RepID=A0A9W6RB30_9PSEU|nr:hypothetical protein Atai01_74310 [Amycolatopsis taiwanensis]
MPHHGGLVTHHVDTGQHTAKQVCVTKVTGHQFVSGQPLTRAAVAMRLRQEIIDSYDLMTRAGQRIRNV